jgi:hypothetical protein
MEPTKDPTFERLMQGYCRFDHPNAQEGAHATARRLVYIAIEIENMIQDMAQGSTCLARDLKQRLQSLDNLNSLLQTAINQSVMVIV